MNETLTFNCWVRRAQHSLRSVCDLQFSQCTYFSWICRHRLQLQLANACFAFLLNISHFVLANTQRITNIFYIRMHESNCCNSNTNTVHEEKQTNEQKNNKWRFSEQMTTTRFCDTMLGETKNFYGKFEYEEKKNELYMISFIVYRSIGWTIALIFIFVNAL